MERGRAAVVGRPKLIARSLGRRISRGSRAGPVILSTRRGCSGWVELELDDGRYLGFDGSGFSVVD